MTKVEIKKTEIKKTDIKIISDSGENIFWGLVDGCDDFEYGDDGEIYCTVEALEYWQDYATRYTAVIEASKESEKSTDDLVEYIADANDMEHDLELREEFYGLK